MIKPKTVIIIFLFLILIMAGCNGIGSSYGKVKGNVYENKLLGFTISKPDSWGIVIAKKDKEKISSTRGESKKERLIASLNSRPIVSMLKSRGQIPSPTVKITVNYDEESPNISMQEIFNGCSTIGVNTFKDYSVVKSPEQVEISGCKAGYMKAHYYGEFKGDKKKYPISYETWIVPRENFFLMISVTSSQMEDIETEVEIASIIKSIKLN